MRIVLTGGGTAGHILPNFAIAEAIVRDFKGAKIFYIGSKSGLEGDLVKREGIPFYSVSTGKLRRYFDLQNFTDLFRIPLGIVQAWFLLGRIKPHLIFSKGGFVGFPVVLAGFLRRIPILTHESDSILGLATRLSAPYADKILLGYEDVKMPLWMKKKAVFVGNPVRSEILKGDAKKALKISGFDGRRQVLLVMGGSTGSQELNEIVAKEKSDLVKHFDVVHIYGEGKKISSANLPVGARKHYFAVPYLHGEMKDFLALASLALSRAGANALAEIEALHLPSLLYPLGAAASRGDQVANAKAFAKKHKYIKIAETGKSAVSQLLSLPKKYGKKDGSAALILQKKSSFSSSSGNFINNPTAKILKIIKSYS